MVGSIPERIRAESLTHASLTHTSSPSSLSFVPNGFRPARSHAPTRVPAANRRTRVTDRTKMVYNSVLGGREWREGGGRGEGRREGRREGGREGGKEGGREGRREGGREGRREGRREGSMHNVRYCCTCTLIISR